MWQRISSGKTEKPKNTGRQRRSERHGNDRHYCVEELEQRVLLATLQLTPLKDNTIYSENGSQSDALGDQFVVGKTTVGNTRRGLVQFDLAVCSPTRTTNCFQAGSSIDRVTLALRASNPHATGTQSIALHRVLHDWGQGNSNASLDGQGTTASSDDPTWTYSHFSSVRWDTAGGDFSSSPSAIVSVDANGNYQSSAADLVNDVRAWLNDPSLNFGWLLKNNNENATHTVKWFDSSDHRTIANRPTLTIDYTPPAGPATISGQKFRDNNGDGIKNGADAGLANWTIFIDANSDGVLNNSAPESVGVCDANATEGCTLTDSAGNYSFTGLAAGTYRVREVKQPGWVQTTTNPADRTVAGGSAVTGVNFGNFQRITIGGRKFNDLDGNGNDNGGTAPGLPNWVVFDDANNDGALNNAVNGNNGLCDASALELCAATAADGSYTLVGAGPGTHRVREVQQPGWVRTTPNPGDLVASSGSNVSGVSFGNFQRVTISGRKFNDLDGDGTDNGGSDPGLPGWAVFDDGIRDGILNNSVPARNGVCDANALELCAVTAGDGTYTITGLGPGTHRIREVPRAGWVQTTPNPADIAAHSGENVSGVGFGNFQRITISGRKFNDLDGNGNDNGGADPGLPGWAIFDDSNLDDVLNNSVPANNGVCDANALEPCSVSAADGSYTISGLGSGRHKIREVRRAGWVQTTVNPLDIVASSGSNVSDVTFGNFQKLTISGRNFNDLDGNGNDNGGTDPGLSGWTIFLDTLTDGVLNNPVTGDGVCDGNAIERCAVTDSSGRYSFDELGPGTYKLREVSKQGWVPTTAVPDIVASSGSDVLGVDFGNVRRIRATLSPVKDNTLYQTSDGSLSNGAGDYIFAGKNGFGSSRRGLLAFDVAGSIPAGVTIQSARLTLHLSQTQPSTQTVELHRLLADWGEGTSNAPGNEGAGTASTTGDATWLHRFFAGTTWATPGGDLSGTASASLPVGDVGSYTWQATAGLEADLQAWLETPSANFGWLLLGNETANGTAKGFDSRENPIVANRPVLTIDYSPPFVPISISGEKFQDDNGNGVKDGADAGLADWIIFLDANDDGVLNNPGSGVSVCDANAAEQCVRTDASGNYSLPNLGPGSYRVREVEQPGWVHTTPDPTDVVAASGVDVAGVDFGDFQRIAVRGRMFNDLDRNGNDNGGTEPGLRGWTLFIDANRDGVLNNSVPAANGVCDPNALESCAVTGADGSYSIAGVEPGTHRIREVPQSGWIQTTLNPADFAASSGVDLAGIDFGNDLVKATTIDLDATTPLPSAFTFTDADGNLTTVAIAGPGAAGRALDIFLNGGVLNRADIFRLALRNTDPTKTTVSVKVTPAAGRDNETSIGSIRGTGLKSLTAAKSDLVSSVDLAGLGTLQVDDIRDGARLQLGGAAASHLKVTADQVGDAVLSFGGILDAVTVNSWADGSVQALVIGAVQSKLGGFGADLIATGQDAKGVSVKSVSVKGGDLAGSIAGTGGFPTPGGVGSIAMSAATGPTGAAVGGKITSAFWLVGGGIGKVTAGGDVTFTAQIGGVLGSVSVLNGDLDATITAGRVGKVSVKNGDARLGVTTTQGAVALGKSPALDAVSITGGNLLGATIDLAAGTKAKSITVAATKNLAGQPIGGLVLGPVSIDELLDAFTAQTVADNQLLNFGSVGKFTIKGDIGATPNTGSIHFSGTVTTLSAKNIRTAVSIGGDLGTAAVDQVLSEFDIAGSLLKSFTTRSTCGSADLADGSPVALANPLAGLNGDLTFASKATAAKITCKLA